MQSFRRAAPIRPLADSVGRWRERWPLLRADGWLHVAPLLAVLLFVVVILAAFSYLRLEEVRREQEALKRDVEYAQQRLRLRLLERQEQLMRLARDISNREVVAAQFPSRAEALVAQTGVALQRGQAAPAELAQRWVADGRAEERLRHLAELALQEAAGLTDAARTRTLAARFDAANRARDLLRSTVRADLAVTETLLTWCR